MKPERKSLPMNIKPCPFCGAEQDKDSVESGYWDDYVVVCQHCGARSARNTTATGAVRKWNKRAKEGK